MVTEYLGSGDIKKVSQIPLTSKGYLIPEGMEAFYMTLFGIKRAKGGEFICPGSWYPEIVIIKEGSPFRVEDIKAVLKGKHARDHEANFIDDKTRHDIRLSGVARNIQVISLAFLMTSFAFHYLVSNISAGVDVALRPAFARDGDLQFKRVQKELEKPQYQPKETEVSEDSKKFFRIINGKEASQ
jgi:hypothetical protein